MDTVTYPDHHVAHFIEEHFVPARVRTKDNPELLKEYFVAWTPNIVITDDQGKVHYRVEGFLQPQDFVAKLSLGAGRYHLNRQEYDQAAERFEKIAERHAGTDAAAEALYWLGVTNFKQSHDPTQLRPIWQRLAEEYPDSDWTKRSKVPELARG
jgi:tetratricopeptide (TPR) repeat protein